MMGDSDADEVLRNLDTQSRRLQEVERALSALDQDDAVSFAAPFQSGDVESYETLVAENDQLRTARAWTETDLDAALTPAVRDRFEAWLAAQRLHWTKGDVVIVGLAGLLGALACVFDDQLDALTRESLGWLKSSEAIQGWELDAKGMPIDYTGSKFGGPGHRLRSPGHDIGRPFQALRQIREGQFEGVFWEEGVKQVFRTPIGAYDPVEGIGPALVLWLKHLIADVVTPMSLPLPGFTHLYELPSHEIRRFAHAMYEGTEWGTGYNVRSALIAPTLGVLLVDVAVRAQSHWSAYSQRKSFSLTNQDVPRQVVGRLLVV